MAKKYATRIETKQHSVGAWEEGGQQFQNLCTKAKGQ